MFFFCMNWVKFSVVVWCSAKILPAQGIRLERSRGLHLWQQFECHLYRWAVLCLVINRATFNAFGTLSFFRTRRTLVILIQNRKRGNAVLSFSQQCFPFSDNWFRFNGNSFVFSEFVNSFAHSSFP